MPKEVGCLPGHLLCLLGHQEAARSKGIVEHLDAVNTFGLRDVKQHVLTNDQAEMIPNPF